MSCSAIKNNVVAVILLHWTFEERVRRTPSNRLRSFGDASTEHRKVKDTEAWI